MPNNTNYFARIIIIAAFTFIAYANTFDSEFHFDDYDSIIAHPYIKSIRNIQYFFYYKGAPLTNRPVTMATFAINYGIGGLDPVSYHYVNFFIHLANALLVYIFLLLTLKERIEKYEGIAFFASLMFAVHPIQTQAVTYIVQRAEILSAFFYLLSLVLFAKAAASDRMEEQRNKKTEDQALEGGRKCRRSAALPLYCASLVSAFLAVGSKEVAITLPITILIYDFFFISDADVRRLLKRWPVYILFFLMLLALMYFMGVSLFKKFFSAAVDVHSPQTSAAYGANPVISRYEYFLTQMRVIWTYIRLLLFPINQSLDYNFQISRGILTPVATLAGGIGIIALLAQAVLFFRRNRVISFFIIWFFLVLSPTSSFAVLPDIIFEHRAYLSSLGYFVIATAGIFMLSSIIFQNRTGQQ